MSTQRVDLSAHMRQAMMADCICVEGRIREVVGPLVEVVGINAAIGDRLGACANGRELTMEVLGVRQGHLLAAPLGSTAGMQRGATVRLKPGEATAEVGEPLLGRVIDAFGDPLDDRPRPLCRHRVPMQREPPPAFARAPINQPIDTGVRVLDALLPVGRGQRLGLFAGTGVGKSTLMAMLCRRARADVVVVGLIGERGREVGHFVRNAFGREGLDNAVVVAATSDAPPLVRVQGALRATAIAEHFRDCGASVLLLMDSVTRYAMALRETTLASGEPPVIKGYTPSVFSALPALFERAGNSSHTGSITAIYTVLVEGDDLQDPIADAVRGTLDGHIVLSRSIAERGMYPAVDVLPSVTRLLNEITTAAHRAAAAHVRDLMGAYREAADLIKIGAYVRGSDERVDAAVEAMPSIEQLIRQGLDEASGRDLAIEQLQRIGEAA